MKSKTYILKSGIIIPLLFFMHSLFSREADLKTGMWRGALKLNDSTELPFNFKISALGFEIINGEENIFVDEIKFDDQDSVFIRTPFFDSEFRVKMTGDSLMTGNWINHNRKDKNVIPFKAKCGVKSRFEIKNWTNCEPVISGKWEVEFEPGTKDSYKAIGEFTQLNVTKGSKLTGTFLTETGDYRYLEGVMANEYFYLSCFDGAHAFLFKAKYDNNSGILNGDFYSGAHGHEKWIAKRNEKIELRNPDSLTYLKPGFSKIDFSFKNLEGKTVSPTDEKYKNKVVIIQLMGTWCPNCVDETKFLSGFHAMNSDKGLEVIALAFERTDNFDIAVAKVKRLKERYVASYDFLITMKTGANQASQALPMLNNVMAFPTTIYIDKKGNVRKIYTGFNGPATGKYYTDYVSETTTFVEKLLAE